MDLELRQLERQAASGDELAEQRLKAAKLRLTTQSTFSCLYCDKCLKCKLCGYCQGHDIEELKLISSNGQNEHQIPNIPFPMKSDYDIDAWPD